MEPTEPPLDPPLLWYPFAWKGVFHVKLASVVAVQVVHVIHTHSDRVP